MTKSVYSRPPSSQTRQPLARANRRGSAASAGVPNRASGRLLPVDVKPGTRQSLMVFPDLDRHGPQQLRLALIQRHAIDHFADRPHDPLPLARLEEIDQLRRPLHIVEEPLQLFDRREWGLAP